MKILHIEHSKMIRVASKDIIESLGHEYIEATGEKDTYEVLKNGEVDLIITGLELDDVDGERLIESLTESDFSMIPIVVLTSYDNLEIRRKLFSLGVVDYQLKKNFNQHRLKSYINAIQLNDELLNTMKSLRVAVVDDSVLTIKIIQNIFELNGIDSVDYYYDAKSLLKSSKDYDIYILDLVLPDTTGETIIGELKAAEKDNIVVMISSTSNFKTIAHILNSGADDFIVKPFDANTFLVRIKHHIKQHILMKELEKSNEKLLKVSITDGLTQVYNHKYIVHRLEEECIRTERYDEDLSIVLFDLDNFKGVNDSYGHQCGDDVLRRVAEAISDTIRESDIVGRYGGEEFLVILPNTNEEASYQVANKIRSCISTLEFEQKNLQVSISGGVSTYKHFSYSQMIMTADMKLLEAKKKGKNRIE